MERRNGPRVRVDLSCFNCRHERAEPYVAQGDSGHAVYCDHPDRAGKRIGDTCWQTPEWCPLAPDVNVETLRARVDELEAERARERQSVPYMLGAESMRERAEKLLDKRAADILAQSEAARAQGNLRMAEHLRGSARATASARAALRLMPLTDATESEERPTCEHCGDTGLVAVPGHPGEPPEHVPCPCANDATESEER